MSYCLNPHCQKPQNYQDAKFCLTCGTKLLLKERYRAIKLIGEGGFGRTLLAVDEDKPSKPPCVIKQFLPQAQGTNNSQKAAELFEQEAQRLDELGKHNQIPELLAYLIQEKSQYLVQEYIDGHNLAETLVEQGNFNELQIWELLNSLLPVLEYVHSSEVIHRDIKPENIIRNQNKQLFLVDFGAAKVVTGTAMFRTETSIGTPEFVAPEQTRGKAVYSSDLYSLGTTCIYLLTGISPFDLFDFSENTWVWRQYLVDNPVSDKLSNVLDKLIENATSRRYQSGSEVLKEINPQKEFTVGNNNYSSCMSPKQASNSATVKPFNYSWRYIYNFTAHTDSINSISISPDGKLLASGSHDSKIKLWEINTGKVVQKLNNGNSVYAIAFSPNGSIIASGDCDNNIQLWNVNLGNKIRTLRHKGSFSVINSLSFSPDGQILASAGSDRIVKLWDVNTGKKIRILRGHKRWVSSVVISLDGLIIASGSADGTVMLWDFNSGKLLKLLDHTNSGAVSSVAFSPDGKLIATGSAEDCSIRLWKISSEQKICNFTGYLSGVRCVTFSPDGKTLATSSCSGDIKLWDINTKQEICTLTGHSAKVNSLVFSPDGRTLFSGSDDKTIKIWRCE